MAPDDQSADADGRPDRDEVVAVLESAGIDEAVERFDWDAERLDADDRPVDEDDVYDAMIASAAVVAVAVLGIVAVRGFLRSGTIAVGTGEVVGSVGVGATVSMVVGAATYARMKLAGPDLAAGARRAASAFESRAAAPMDVAAVEAGGTVATGAAGVTVGFPAAGGIHYYSRPTAASADAVRSAADGLEARGYEVVVRDEFE